MLREGDLEEGQKVTQVDLSQNFFNDPIVVQCGRDSKSRIACDEVKQKLSRVGKADVETVSVSGMRGVTIFHRGNVIAGPRVQTFMDYIDKIARKRSIGGK